LPFRAHRHPVPPYQTARFCPSGFSLQSLIRSVENEVASFRFRVSYCQKTRSEHPKLETRNRMFGEAVNNYREEALLRSVATSATRRPKALASASSFLSIPGLSPSVVADAPNAPLPLTTII